MSIGLDRFTVHNVLSSCIFHVCFAGSEIQKRQKNWMQQREMELKKKPSSRGCDEGKVLGKKKKVYVFPVAQPTLI